MAGDLIAAKNGCKHNLIKLLTRIVVTCLIVFFAAKTANNSTITERDSCVSTLLFAHSIAQSSPAAFINYFH